MRNAVGAAIAALMLALSAPAHAGHKPGAAPYDEVLLYVPWVSITWSQDGVMCLDHEFSILTDPGVVDGTAVGPPWLLAPYEEIPNGWILRGAGHTVVLRVGSRVALVDRKPFELERVVRDDPTISVPLNRLGAVFGYRFLTGSYKDGDGNVDAWFIRLPKGRRVPDDIAWVRRVIVRQRDFVLVIWKDRPGEGPRENCGDLYRGWVEWANQQVWGEATRLAKEAGWAFRWDRRRERGEIRFERGLARVRLTRDRTGLPHSVVVEQTAYPLPARWKRAVAAGRLLLPLEAVARALGWQYHNYFEGEFVLWISPP